MNLYLISEMMALKQWQFDEQVTTHLSSQSSLLEAGNAVEPH